MTIYSMPVGTPKTGTLRWGEQRPVGLGVIGLGAFGRFCLEAYATMPDIHIVAIADPDPDALARGTNLAPHALAYDDPALLVGLPAVDVVAICAPPDRHLALVLAVVVAGKHIVCDKPLGVSLAWIIHEAVCAQYAPPLQAAHPLHVVVRCRS